MNYGIGARPVERPKLASLERKMNFLALLEQAGAIGTLLKFERGPESEYRGVLKSFSGEWRRRCRAPPPGWMMYWKFGCTVQPSFI